MNNFSTSFQRRKRGKRTEYIARLTYYDKTEKRKGVSKSAPTHWDARRELQDLIDQHGAGGSEILEARNMTFAALAEHCGGKLSESSSWLFCAPVSICPRVDRAHYAEGRLTRKSKMLLAKNSTVRVRLLSLSSDSFLQIRGQQ